ncbi:MAG: hypothetical protein PHR35_09990, partial [Kiritimatiellae bacterium]|nr:hypothetical protein [Kiritimatiellia bacterium]
MESHIQRLRRHLTLSLILVLVRAAGAVTLTADGVLGNSGGGGARLVRVATDSLHNTGSGVAVTPDMTLWYAGGDRINHLSPNGSLIEAFPLRPEGSRVEAGAFAVVQDRLHFLGRSPTGLLALFALPVDGREAFAAPVTDRFPWSAERLLIASSPLDGKLVALPAQPPGKELEVYLYDPASNAWTRAFGIPGRTPTGLAVDPQRRVLYVGGRLFPNSDAFGITCVTPAGTVASPGFPVRCLKTSMTPVHYSGHVCLAGGALWELAWYGYLARLDLAANLAPGTIELWHNELGAIPQIVDMGDSAGRSTDVLACAAAGNEALYIGHWEPSSRKLRWVRRIGCLPVISSLWITPEGWVSAGTSRCQAWWRFEDAADAPPRKPEMHVAVTPTAQRGSQCLAIAWLYGLPNRTDKPPVAAAFSWETTPFNEAQSVREPLPLAAPVGLALENPAGDGKGWLFVSDADTRKIWRTAVWRPSLRPDNAQWKPLKYVDSAVEEEMKTATDLAWGADNTLLVAITNALVLLKEEPSGYAFVWRFEQWGDTTESCFGKHLHISLSGDRLLASDTDRHRVLLFDAATRRLLAQAGETDRPGAGPGRFHFPVQVSLAGQRAVVADTGNQRIVKLAIGP